MNPYLIPLAALALMTGACSSPQVSQNAQPVPAQPAGTVVTQWGDLPVYTTGYKANPLVFNSPRLPTPSADYYRGEFDLLVERDGTVRDVFIRRSSDFPDADKAIAAQFLAARSRLVLAPSDPAPYVIRYTLVRNTELVQAGRIETPLYVSSRDHPDFYRPMGTGAPYWGKP
jgi:hypothetical protein